MTDDQLEAIHQTFHRLESRWILPIPDATTWFAYDPLPLKMFLEGIDKVSALTDGRRFLDVGCGIGTKLALMNCLGWQVTGIEHVDHYVDAARELVPEATIHHCNALDFNDFDFDVIYMYRPARDPEIESRLEQHVLDHTKPGTVMFFPLMRNPEVWSWQ